MRPPNKTIGLSKRQSTWDDKTYYREKISEEFYAR
jgi:hypothetical protein